MDHDLLTTRAIYSARCLARALSGASGNIGAALAKAAPDTPAVTAIAAALASEDFFLAPQPNPNQIHVLRDLVKGPPNAFLLVSEKDEQDFRESRGLDLREVILTMNEVGLCVVGQPVKETPAPGAPEGSKQWTAVATPTGRAAMVIYDEAVKRADRFDSLATAIDQATYRGKTILLVKDGKVFRAAIAGEVPAERAEPRPDPTP